MLTDEEITLTSDPISISPPINFGVRMNVVKLDITFTSAPSFYDAPPMPETYQLGFTSTTGIPSEVSISGIIMDRTNTSTVDTDLTTSGTQPRFIAPTAPAVQMYRIVYSMFCVVCSIWYIAYGM